jgi:hypothetical protein
MEVEIFDEERSYRSTVGRFWSKESHWTYTGLPVLQVAFGSNGDTDERNDHEVKGFRRRLLRFVLLAACSMWNLGVLRIDEKSPFLKHCP